MNDSLSGADAGSDSVQSTSDESDSSHDGNGQRGLFGRLIYALASPESPAEKDRLYDASMRRVLPGLASLRRLRVADVAIPKAEIVSVPVDIDRDDLIEVLRESGFSRVPVYCETLDKPLGLLLLKDLVLRHGFDANSGDINLEPLLRPLLFVPPSMPLVILLQKMQAERTHMALVIDEYGGVDGLVTIEDLLEQVVGEIEDEHDTADEGLWVEEKQGVWLVQARAMLEDVERLLGLRLTDGVTDDDVDTLGGLVFLLLGRVPVRGEVITHPAGVEIEVIEADPRRVKRLRLRYSEPAADAAEG